MAQNLNIKSSQKAIKEIFKEIKAQTNLSVIYSLSDMNPDKVINIEAANEPVSKTIEYILKEVGGDLVYVIKDGFVVISKRGAEKQSPVGTTQKSTGTKKVKGIIADEKKEPLTGVSVTVPGTTIGVISGVNGSFELDVPTNKNELLFSFMGYERLTVDIKGKNQINPVLKEEQRVLNEVVITAMGIERKAKSLTYATQVINTQDITRAKETNFVSALQGKSAGLVITPNSSGAGGGAAKIQLRGQTSILGTNQPLIVLDGIPLSNGLQGQVGSLQYSAGRDGGDILSTLNPDDIASITVLKGPNSAALYGSRANNGVLIINTKGGREGKIRVELSSNTTIETPLLLPKLQKEFGGNINEGYSMNYDGWGKRISEFTSEEIARLPYATKSPRNNITDFLQTGMTFNNSVSISGGTELSRSYFSYGSTIQQGMVPTNKFMRHNVLFKHKFLLFEKHLDLDLSFNYINESTTNRPSVGKALNPLYNVYRTPANVDLRYFRENYQHIAKADDPFVKGDKGAVNPKLEGQPVQTWPWFQQYMNNPYWLINRLNNVSDLERFIGTLSAKVTILPEKLHYQTRLNLDRTISRGNVEEYASLFRNAFNLGGGFYRGRSENLDVFSDHLLMYNQKVVENINMNLNAGTSLKRSNSRYLSVGVAYIDTASVPNRFFVGNSLRNVDQSSLYSNEGWGSNWEAAVFATTQFSFWDKAYLDLTWRTEWAKSFQQFAFDGRYKSYSYYSMGGNVLMHELFPNIKKTFDNLKVRVSASLVGNPIPNDIYFGQSVDASGRVTSRDANFDNPKAEQTRSYEIGVDATMLNNKLTMELTAYQATMSDQFLRISTITGQSKPINGGHIRNRGIELTTNYRWTFNKDLSWTIGVNMAYNHNKILKTYEPADGSTVEPLEIGDAAFKAKFVKGGVYGDLYVNSFERDKNGKILIDPNGSPIMATGEFKTFVGNATARFTYGWNNSFSYKNLSLYMLFDGKIGGKVMSLTEADLDAFGLSQRTADARNNGGKVKLPDGQEVDAVKYYQTVGKNPMENYVYDATNIRLREFSMGYSFFDLFGASKHLNISIIGRNLGFLYKKSPVDPDISMTAANGLGGIDVYALPTTRSIGLNIKVTF